MQGEQALAHHDHASMDATDVFGFWLYIMTDCILFSCLFATFIVLNFQGMDGHGLKGHIDLYGVLKETMLLLVSNLTFCLAVLSLNANRPSRVQFWLLITFLLGAGFVYLEVSEFAKLVHEGYSWQLSGQLSSFFTLVGTHGLHVSVGLMWILVMISQFFTIQEYSVLRRRMTYLGLFWNFLDIVWIFVFSIVYLMGAL